MPRYDDTFVDRFLEPRNRDDVDGALALMTDDCVWKVTRGREPHGKSGYFASSKAGAPLTANAIAPASASAPIALRSCIVILPV
jgi:ketosteroid isomerase-like protein